MNAHPRMLHVALFYSSGNECGGSISGDGRRSVVDENPMTGNGLFHFFDSSGQILQQLFLTLME
jgi:hypothetical protein